MNLHRALLLLAVVLAALALGAPGPTGAAPPRCTCTEGNACYHFLNAPVTPVDDPCSCPLCRAKSGACPKDLPDGWSRTCANNSRMDCFLRRHAASWNLACSDQLDGKCDCKNPHPEWCPQCGSDGSAWNDAGKELIKRQVEIERRVLGPRKKFVAIKSPHFYLVTDIRSLKIKTQAGSPRIMGMHELAHVYVQRAELAWRDFAQYFGKASAQTSPMAIYLMDKSRVLEDIQAAYFGSPRTNIIYGGGTGRAAGGICANGFGASMQKASDDYGLHLQVRHSIGHIIMSCWQKVAPNPPELHTWMYVGAGHWLARLPRNLRERATFCANEGTAVSHSGKKWDQKARKFAAGGVPIQRVFDVTAISGFDLEMHIRAWSWFSVFLEEDRETFVKFLAGIRAGKDHRIAMKEAFGCDPEEFERRWRERVLGQRGSVAPTAKELDESDPDRPGAMERAAIRAETDLPTLASRIKALQAVSDPLTASTIVPMLRHDSELVREIVVLVLSRTKSAEVKEWLRTTGLSAYKGVTRAYVARVLGNLGDKESGDELLEYAGDGFWLTRAHVARALGMIRHEAAVPVLKERVKDKAPKVCISAMDALANFGERAGSGWEVVSAQLSASSWQVRSAAAECLGALGNMRAVDPLIDRMIIESGRIRKDIREALKQITRDDLGSNPAHWSDWWKKEKTRHPGLPKRPEAPKKGDASAGEDYGKPTYYGIRVFSEGVGYVLDVSNSMLQTIKIDPGWLKKHRRKYKGEASKYDLARNEIEANLKTLDARVRFNLYFFRKTAFSWKSSLTPASSSNIGAAVSRMANEKPKPPPPPRPGDPPRPSNRYMTNYVDVFRLVLDIKRGKGLTGPGNFGDTPDTIYFLTDGRPTTGDITDPEVLVEWFIELNRFARVRVHVITFGNLGVDREFLQRLAEQNGGMFVQVPEVR